MPEHRSQIMAIRADIKALQYERNRTHYSPWKSSTRTTSHNRRVPSQPKVRSHLPPLLGRWVHVPGHVKQAMRTERAPTKSCRRVSFKDDPEIFEFSADRPTSLLRSFFVNDIDNRRYLVDTGSAISILTHSDHTRPQIECEIDGVRSANGSPIKTALNACAETNAYPLPNPTCILNSVVGFKFYTKMDLVRAYFQIPMDPDLIHLTAV
ncbi:hypothetical protein Ciccas_011428, partial [Cichlidogyrus casuarinus]